MTFESLVKELQDKLKMKSPKIEKDVRIQGEGRAFIVDLVMEDQNSIFFIELQRKLSQDTIAKFFEAKEWITKSPKSHKERIFLIAAQDTDQISEKMAALLDIKVERIPISRYDIDVRVQMEPIKIKITANKAWKVVIALLRYQPTSIYNIMKKSEVSYGEAHRVVSYLRNRDLLTQKGNFVSVSDLRPILNAVFWERPLKSLMVEHYYIKNNIPGDIPRLISELLRRNDIDHAFTGIAAYERYFGGIRNESSYGLYVDTSNQSFRGLIREIISMNESGIHLLVYKPDRDVFMNSKSVENTQLVDTGQLLLDLCGGDKIELQLATEMVKHIDKI
ncbi:MAG: hypothetical protein ACYCT2_07490 [Thermoplasmataceae archaeon]